MLNENQRRGDFKDSQVAFATLLVGRKSQYISAGTQAVRQKGRKRASDDWRGPSRRETKEK